MFTARIARRSLEAFLTWSERFCVAMLEDGTLCIRPLSEDLEAGDLQTLLASLSRTIPPAAVREVVFDFAKVTRLGPNPTLIWAMILNLTQCTGIPCRLAGLQALPAAAASMYRRNRELMNLIAA